MRQQKKICLSCRNFSLQDTQSGVCKVVKGLPVYPLKTIDDTCGQWRDCGQQYFIRTGWIKRQQAKETGDEVITGTGIIH
jgi:hypothetical protein